MLRLSNVQSLVMVVVLFTGRPDYEVAINLTPVAMKLNAWHVIFT